MDFWRPVEEASRTAFEEFSARAGTEKETATARAKTEDHAGNHRTHPPVAFGWLQCERFTYLGSTEAAIQHLVEKSQEVGQVQPEAAVEAPGIETPVDERIMPLDHHETFAFQAMHE
jgi:hypothetical protein